MDGTIPTELGHLVSLKKIDLGINYISGTLPTELAQLTNLQHLALYQNQFVGMVPEEYSVLTDLTTLLVDNNDLIGAIPQGVCDLMPPRNEQYQHYNNFDKTEDDPKILDHLWADCFDTQDNGETKITCNCECRCCTKTYPCKHHP